MTTKFSKILIDISNVYHKNMHTNKNLTTTLEDGTSLITGGIFGTIRSINKLEREHGSDNCQVYLLFDNTTSGGNKRKEIDPEYKANREKKDHSFYKGLDYLRFILMNYKDNFIVSYRTGYEADDAVLPIISKFDKNENVLLVSEDMDWARSLSDNVFWFTKKEIWSSERFEEKYGFKPSNDSVVFWKSLKGDVSDNIPKGILGIRENLVQQLIVDFKDVDEMLNNLDNISYLSDKWKDKIRENKARLKLNAQLVDFITTADENIDEFIFPCEFKPNTLRTLYHALGFTISSFDPRLLKVFPPKNASSDSFFNFQEIGRSKP